MGQRQRKLNEIRVFLHQHAQRLNQQGDLGDVSSFFAKQWKAPVIIHVRPSDSQYDKVYWEQNFE